MTLINIIIYLWYWVFSTSYRLLSDDFMNEPWYKFMSGASDYIFTIALSVLVCCFFIGLISSSGDMYHRRSPESVIKSFFRVGIAAFLLSGGGQNIKAITSGIYGIGRDLVDKIFHSGLSKGNIDALFTMSQMSIYQHISGENSFYESLPSGSNFAFALKAQDAVTKNLFTTIVNIFPMMVELILLVVIAAVCLIIIINIYGRLIKIALYTVIAPIPLSTFSSHETSRIGRGFLRSYIGLCLEGAVVMMILLIFGSMVLSGTGDYSLLGATPNDPEILKDSTKAMGWIFCFLIELTFQSLICLSLIKGSSVMIREIMGY